MAVSFASAVIGSNNSPALPSPLNDFDLLFAISSVENVLDTVIAPPASQSGDWNQIGSTLQLDAVGGTNDFSVGWWWARKTAANLASGAAWSSSLGGVHFTSYVRVTGGKRTGTPFGAVNVGYRVTSDVAVTNPMPTGPITPTADKTLILCLRGLWNWQNTSSSHYSNERGDAGAAGPHGVYDDGILSPAGSTGTLDIIPGGSFADPWAAMIIAVEEEPLESPPINSQRKTSIFPGYIKRMR